MVKIGLVIPWKETPSRVRPLQALLDWYKTNLPDIEIFFANASDSIWLPSASRNLGVRKAQEAHCDVIILNDADTLPELNALTEAIKAAQDDGLIHLPYTLCKYLDEEQSQYFYDGQSLDSLLPSQWFNDACGGVWVTTPETWWNIGGMDEKFKQWGAEDYALLHAHRVIKQLDMPRHEGTIYSLGHTKQEQDAGYNLSVSRNGDLWRMYLNITDAEELKKFIKLH